MIPRATYRLQFHKGFPFEAAVRLTSYFARLGISHIYSSPILKSRAGSRHGYDVIDHGVIDPELGGEDGFRRLAAALREHGLGIVLDIVPNHMAVHNDNHWWMDVLEHGHASPYAGYFDIDWDMHGRKVLTAFLGQPYWQALEAGEIKVVKNAARERHFISYFDWRFPIRAEDQREAEQAFGSLESLHSLLQRQHYRLAWWRIANDEINWRRFFDIPDLIALNQSQEDVFEATHAKVFALFAEGLIDGVRVDHIDGLSNPADYCQRLRGRLEEIAHVNGRTEPPYIVVEKILGAAEELPLEWRADGTTGYDFMNDVSALQHDPSGAAPLARAWHRISGRSPEFEDEERLARGEIVHRSFEGALSRTSQAFEQVVHSSRSGRDISGASLRRGLVRVLQQLRVYRTYATGHPGSPKPGVAFERATDAAKRGANGTDAAAIDFHAAVMSGTGGIVADRSEAVRRFNQLSAPVAAKAVEDTAFYRYGRLLSRNDVGFHPATLSIDAAEFHARNAKRAASFPNGLLATATHDHKRGEDARARLAALSEIPEEWERTAETWFALNEHLRSPGMDEGDEYQLYQTLVASWPLDLNPDDPEQLSRFCERILAWRLKSLHEAKLRTSWLDPDSAYEKANEFFVRALLTPERAREFRESLRDFIARISPGAAMNGLAQVALRCLSPGVPDCYQGTEFWDLSLVDPDNRRRVDYDARTASLSQAAVLDLLQTWRDGRIKQTLLFTLLNLRKSKPALFARGAYVPLEAHGPRAENVAAFVRGLGEDTALLAVPLRCARHCTEMPLPDPAFWADTTIALPEPYQRRWQHAFDHSPLEGPALLCRALFARFPVAVLI